MNCPNCGAPMRLVAKRNYFVCDFCTTFKFPEKKKTGSDRVQTIGVKSETLCPICEMDLTEALIERYPVLHCEKCRGVLATNDEFLKIVRKIRSESKDVQRDHVAINPTELKRQVGCPRCSKTMDVHPYYGPGAVVIDTCPRCQVIWLDHGEISVIETAPGHR